MQQNKLISALILYKSVKIPFDQIQKECSALIEGMNRKAQRKLLELKNINVEELTESAGIMLGLSNSDPLQIAQIYNKRVKELLNENLAQNISDYKKWLKNLEFFINSFNYFFLYKYDKQADSDLHKLYIIVHCNLSPSQRKELSDQFRTLVLNKSYKRLWTYKNRYF